MIAKFNKNCWNYSHMKSLFAKLFIETINYLKKVTLIKKKILLWKNKKNFNINYKITNIRLKLILRRTNYEKITWFSM